VQIRSGQLSSAGTERVGPSSYRLMLNNLSSLRWLRACSILGFWGSAMRMGGGPSETQAFSGNDNGLRRDLPQDLAQFVVEATLGLPHGFWGFLAKGATLKSIPGRRRTQPGQQLIRHADTCAFAICSAALSASRGDRTGRVEARRRWPVAAREPAPRQDGGRGRQRRGPASSVMAASNIRNQQR
jgi:hypothetical protein